MSAGRGAGADVLPAAGIRTFAIVVVGLASGFAAPCEAAYRAVFLISPVKAFLVPARYHTGTGSFLLEYLRAPALPEDKRTCLSEGLVPGRAARRPPQRPPSRNYRF